MTRWNDYRIEVLLRRCRSKNSSDRNGTARQFVVDPSFEVPQVIAELDTTGTVLSWYGFGRTRHVQLAGQQSLFFGEDLHSGTRVLYDESVAIQSTYSYDAYGNAIESGSAIEFGYRNEQRDADSGLIFLRARYYDPSTGTFISRDPFVGFQDSPLSLNDTSMQMRIQSMLVIQPDNSL